MKGRKEDTYKKKEGGRKRGRWGKGRKQKERKDRLIEEERWVGGKEGTCKKNEAKLITEGRRKKERKLGKRKEKRKQERHGC